MGNFVKTFRNFPKTWLIILIGILCVGATLDPIVGQHLLVLPIEITPILMMERNASGHVVKLSGVSVLAFEWLSNSLKFSYTILDNNVRTMEDTSSSVGGTSFLKQKKADLILASVAMTSTRYSQMDFPYTFLISPFGLLIPMPTLSNDLRAFWKPLQSSVWLALLISLLFIIGYIFIKSSCNREGEGNENSWLRLITYFLAVLLFQGGVSPHRTMKIRFLFGIWCLALLVLGIVYNTVLVSFITLPIYQPLINSIFDIPKSTGVRVTVDKDRGADLYFRESEAGITKFIGDMLKEEPKLRCTKTDECVDRVRMGFAVYAQRAEILLDLIGRDYKKMNCCDFALAKEKFMSYQTSLFAMAKDGPYTQHVTKELMKAESVGLLHFWWKMSTADPTRCLNMLHDRQVAVPTLTLSHLRGAFVVLGIGYGLTFLVFISEMIYNLYHQKTIIVEL